MPHNGLAISSRRPRIGLLIETSRGYGRGVLQGIAAFAQRHGPWSIYHQERSLADPDPRWLKSWRGDGILARLDNPRLIRAIMKRKLPVVGLTGAHASPDVPLVLTDERAIMRLAVDHLRERGFAQLAFCGFPGAYYSDIRESLFQKLAGKSAVAANVFRPRRRSRPETTPAAEQQGLRDDADLARWLAALPKPIGLVACNDIRAQQVINQCGEIGIAIPDEVAVLGVDDDELVCELCDPPLSSVRQDTFQIGFQAAAMLDQQLRGKSVSTTPTLVKPLGITHRASTDVAATADVDLAAAVRYIRDHACQNIRVADVLTQVTLSRSTLERRFADALGRSPKEEIDRVRLAAVRRLLATTDYKMSHVAQLTGFPHMEYLTAYVKLHTGQTPVAWRHALRSSTAAGTSSGR
jgi:LacI family transcriptional regulator